MSKPLTALFVAGTICIAGIFVAHARPEYAQKEKKNCSYCHLNSGGGGNRNFRGVFYGANNLTFEKFVEANEASIAGVEPGSESAAAKPKVGYAGNVTGPRPAANQIQALALRTPVLVAFFTGSTAEEKSAAKVLKKIAAAYGSKVFVVGVSRGDFTQALNLSAELGSQLRVFADTDGGAAKKFGAVAGLDLVVISKRGEEFKLIGGFSKSNLETAIAQVGTFGVPAPEVDLADAPAEVIHGAKIGG
jgi:hypothetical protein